jgi:hypothetical protein
MVIDRLRFAQSTAAVLACSLGACALLVGPPDGHRVFESNDGDAAVAPEASTDASAWDADDSSSGPLDAAGDAAGDAAAEAANAGDETGVDAEAGRTAFAGPVITLASGENAPEGIVQTSGALYWADYGDSTIHRLARSSDGWFGPVAADSALGSTPFASTALALAPPPTDLLADTLYLYALVGVFVTSQNCATFLPSSRPGDGGTLGCAYPTSVCSGTVNRLAQDGSNLYLSGGLCGSASSSYIFVEAAPGTNNVGWTKIGPLSAPASAMAGDTVKVYFAIRNQLFSQELATTAFDPSPIAQSPLNATITDVAVDDANVYWADNMGNVAEISKSGAILQQPLASGQNHPFRLAQDGSNLYWTNAGTQSNDGSIAMVPKSGGAPTILASNQGHPWGITVDDNGVYWTDYATSTVMMLAR